MKSFTTLRNLFGSLTNNNSSTNLTLGDQLINDAYRMIVAERDFDFEQKTAYDFTIADYTTGTVDAATNASKTVTGSGTTWAVGMAGRYIQIGDTGDSVWYRIDSVESTTSLTLTDAYNGTTIGAGAAASYTIRKRFYALPYDYDKLINTTVTVGNITYTPKECPTLNYWTLINQTQYTSDFPEWFFIYDGEIGYYPILSSAGNLITYNYDRRVFDLSVADETGGNVSAVTNGSTTVTGSGTSWTASMAGRFIRLDISNTAANSGDSYWYEIKSVASTTSLTLEKAYQGTTRSAATINYTIGQMPILSEQYHDLPVYYAAYVYFTGIQPDTNRATGMKRIFDEKFAQLISDGGSKTTSPVIEDTNGYLLNPNLTIFA